MKNVSSFRIIFLRFSNFMENFYSESFANECIKSRLEFVFTTTRRYRTTEGWILSDPTSLPSYDPCEFSSLRKLHYSACQGKPTYPLSGHIDSKLYPFRICSGIIHICIDVIVWLLLLFAKLHVTCLLNNLHKTNANSFTKSYEINDLGKVSYQPKY